MLRLVVSFHRDAVVACFWVAGYLYIIPRKGKERGYCYCCIVLLYTEKSITTIIITVSTSPLGTIRAFKRPGFLFLEGENRRMFVGTWKLDL